MGPIRDSVVVFACVFSSVLLGMFLRNKPLAPYLSEEVKDAIKLALGVIATMNALVLGLLISTAKGSYDLKRAQLTQISADAILLDRILGLYGPETRSARKILGQLLFNLVDQLEAFQGARSRQGFSEVKDEAEALYQSIQALDPRDSGQKSVKEQAFRVAFEMSQIRALALARQSSSIPAAFLVILTFWLTVLFTGFGLFAPPNFATVTALAICAISVSVAIFLILQMDQPFVGIMRISLEPLRNAINALGA